jgi:hypothetical protein
MSGRQFRTYTLTRDDLEAHQNQISFATDRMLKEMAGCFKGDPLGNDHILNSEAAKRVAHRYSEACNAYVPYTECVRLFLGIERAKRAVDEIEEPEEPSRPWGSGTGEG